MIIGGLCLLLSRRGVHRDFDRAYETGRESSVPLEWDSLASELSARIFDPEDADFVAREMPGKHARQFRQERTGLALEWLRAVRGQVNQLIRGHLRAARGSNDLKPADEIRLWFEFLLFQLTSGILYLIIWAYGPTRAARLVGYSLELAGQLRKVTDDVIPSGRQVAAELMNGKPVPKNGNAV